MGTLNGQCACGNIRFELTAEPLPRPMPARACDCSFCAPRGLAWTSVPRGQLRVTLEQPQHVQRIRFATGTADFHQCGICDEVSVVTSEIDGKTHAVVGVQALRGVAPDALDRQTVSLGDEPVAARLARRQRGWIGDVQITHGNAARENVAARDATA